MNSTPTHSDGPMLDSESPEETSDPVVAPPVVAVVVTKDPGPWLEEGLSALGASERRRPPDGQGMNPPSRAC